MHSLAGQLNPVAWPRIRDDSTEVILRLRLHRLLVKLDYCLGNSVHAISSRRSLPGDVICTLSGMAILAAETELCGFAAICLRLAERLEPLRQQRMLPPESLIALTEWMLEADRYLRRPQSRVRSAALVMRLNDETWCSALQESERLSLIDATCLARR